MGASEQGADAAAGRWLTIPRTLIFLTNGDDVLLMKRAAHKRIFPNRYNGVGGHIERGEDPITSARRETLEETGLDVPNLVLRAVYHIDTGAETGIVVFIFTGESPSRDVIDCTEGTLHWVNRNQLDTVDLVEDIPVLLERILPMNAGDPVLFYHLSYSSGDVLQMRLAGN